MRKETIHFLLNKIGDSLSEVKNFYKKIAIKKQM